MSRRLSASAVHSACCLSLIDSPSSVLSLPLCSSSLRLLLWPVTVLLPLPLLLQSRGRRLRLCFALLCSSRRSSLLFSLLSPSIILPLAIPHHRNQQQPTQLNAHIETTWRVPHANSTTRTSREIRATSPFASRSSPRHEAPFAAGTLRRPGDPCARAGTIHRLHTGVVCNLNHALVRSRSPSCRNCRRQLTLPRFFSSRCSLACSSPLTGDACVRAR